MIDLAGELAPLLAPMLEELRQLRAELAALRAASPPRLVDVREAARMTGVSARSIWRRVADGTIPSTRIGRSVRINAADLRPEARA